MQAQPTHHQLLGRRRRAPALDRELRERAEQRRGAAVVTNAPVIRPGTSPAVADLLRHYGVRDERR